MNKFMKPMAAILIAAGTLGLTGCAQTTPIMPDVIQVENAKDNVIVVQSSEEVKVVPDIAEIQFAIINQADDAKTCQEQNSTDLNKAITFLKESGIDETSIQTSNYGLNPIYDWNMGQTITGYEMRTNITVSDLPLDQVGALLTSCVDAGINNIDNVSYLSSDYETSYQEALKKAIESAQTKAQTIAEAGGCTLGNIVHIEEYNINQQVRYSGYNAGAKQELAGAAAAMDVAPGQVSIEAQITVEFAIQ